MIATPAQIADTIDQQFNKWRNQLIAASSTPFMMVGMGHNHRQGMAITCLDEGCTPAMAVEYLEKLVVLLRATAR